MACTTILVGKNASYDGSTLVARNEDSPSDVFCSKRFTVVHPKDQGSVYKSVLSHVEIPLPKNPMRYTCMPNAILNEGIWGAVGVNELNISMSATETITSNPRVLGADPLVVYSPASGRKGSKNYKPEIVGGIGEEDMVTLVLPYIKSARDGVKRLGELLEKYGTYEMNGIAFQDENEIWWLETIGGHHWMAKRVPDNSYVIMPNQQGIDFFDFKDAYGKQVNHICCKNLEDFVKENFLDLSLDNKFNARFAFGSDADSDHIYNTPRAWVLQRFLNPRSNTWDGENADYRPDSNDIPWARVPERKITPADVKYVLSHHFQGTKYDPYSKSGCKSEAGKFRAIGVNRNSFLGFVQIRPYKPEAFRSIEWLALGSNVFNAIVPFYANIDDTPEYFKNTTNLVTTESFYWANRIIGALSDAHFAECSNHIERYQNLVHIKCNEIINKYDKIMEKMSYKVATKTCQKANDEIAKIVKELTYSTLDKVLETASHLMKNSFSRSDA